MIPRVVIADPHPLYLRGLSSLLEAEANLAIVATATNGLDALEALAAQRPDLAILSQDLPAPSGIEIATRANRDALETRIVLVAASIDDSKYVEVLEQQVAGVIHKEDPAEIILACISAVLEGRSWHESSHARRALDLLVRRRAESRQLRQRLTPREVQLVSLATAGLRNKEIAERLDITEGTVKLHLHRIYSKLGVDGRLQLMRYAQDRGMA